MKIRKILIAAMVACSTSLVSAEETKPADMMANMSYPMQKSMDPQVWMQMMTMMMDPQKATSMENCALCHEQDDLDRYEKDFGPMMQASQQMAKSMSPHQMMQSMNPMMSGMMNPMAMMNPMMSMMYPMMGMMNPMMAMMNPMMMGGMMGGMNPMMGMNPMSGMMGGMNPMMGMNPMGVNNGNPMGQMMNPEQYTQWFDQMSEMMKQFAPMQTEPK